jgi:cytochrome c biogenesis protein CcmG, thiol:disulfide interchange protein DsbE
VTVAPRLLEIPAYRTRAPQARAAAEVWHSYGMRLALIALAAAALVAVVAVGLHQSQEGSGAGPPKPRQPSASEVRQALAGAPPQLASLHRQANDLLPGRRTGLDARLRSLRGHPVVVNIWAAWCGPCREELPILQSAALRHGKNVAFVGVDLRDDRGSAARLLREIPLTYPSYEDPDGKIFTAYRLVGTPSTIFYDAAGKQTFVHQGAYFHQADLESDIRRYALGRDAPA